MVIKENFISPSQILINSKISSLPVDIFTVSKYLNIKVLPFSYIRKFEYEYPPVKNKKLASFCDKNPFGFAIKLNNLNLIFYDEFQPSDQTRWTIAHEIAHIILCHTENQVNSIPLKENKKSIFDIEADDFAAKLLCPFIVAHFCTVTSPKEIKQLSQISLSASQIIYNNINFKREKN
ncbi:MAG: ImmA/IrrE family metallo-endopeptidase, partial [Oscillospiraceae bacterium]